METVNIDSITGMRIGVPVGDELRGSDKVYDPWLRIPIEDVNRRAKKMISKYPNNVDGVIDDINAGGANHINRVFFNKVWAGLDNREKFAAKVIKRGSPRVNVLFMQFYAHRLYEKKLYAECYDMLQRSTEIAKQFPHPSWDKWVVSGNFFQARYHFAKEEKAHYCIKTIMEPRILDFSPHLKYWKIFRAAAWLVGNDINTPEASVAIKRYESLGFDGYTEIRGGGKDQYCSAGLLDNPKKCRSLMTDDLQHHLGNP